MMGRIGVPSLTEPIILHFPIRVTDPRLEMIEGFDVR
jgi:hypothetical protein